MTDKQFEIFLALLSTRLDDAIRETVDLLPEEARKEGKDFLGNKFIHYPAVKPLCDLSDFLKEQATAWIQE